MILIDYNIISIINLPIIGADHKVIIYRLTNSYCYGCNDNIVSSADDDDK